MIACVDVQYEGTKATTALVLFDDWHSPEPAKTYVEQSECEAGYVPGEFYKRELPSIQSVLKLATVVPNAILIDGYVWLHSQGEQPRPGLGAHLFKAMDQQVPIIGVAKSRFKSSDAIEIVRGKSQSPLFVTATGMDPKIAADYVKGMHGDFRLPTLIRLTDQLARLAKPSSFSSNIPGYAVRRVQHGTQDACAPFWVGLKGGAPTMLA